MFVLVVAKEPVPGRVKTRLCPPCTPDEAAALAEAALVDTFASACASGADLVIAALDGEPGPWLPSGVHVMCQPDASFGERLATAWRDAVARTGTGGIQIGMDTPQVTPSHLDHALTRLGRADTDAVLGLADDGGWWLLGLPADVDHATVFRDVPMSTERTGAAQRDQLEGMGLRVRSVPRLVDVDSIEDARRVARDAPATRFADTLRRLDAATIAG